jgi:hypothetical protein
MSSIEENGHSIDLNSGNVEQSYFAKRMEVLGITAANNTISAVNPNMPGTDPYSFPLFEETDKGDIKINYFQLNGWHTNYKQGGEGWAKVFHRTRLKHPRMLDDGKEMKYQSPKGSGNFPYFPVAIIDKYREKEPIPLLVITEGEFKAVVGCKYGLDVIGISGIHNFYSNFESKTIHPDIVELLRVCQVRKLLFLTDADTTIIKYQPDKDLAKRPNLFFSAIKNFREAMMYEMDNKEKGLWLTDVYYGHLLPDFAEHNQKGLDDLLSMQINKDKVTDDLAKLQFAETYFWCQNIVVNLNKIQERFGLSSVQNFYEVYGKYIGGKEFVFKNQTYVWNTDFERIDRIKHRDVDNYMRIGCDWFKKVRVPNKYNELEESVRKWSAGEISRDYSKKYPNFMEEIPKYDAWCNQPSMNGTYARVHNGCFNLFNPLKHEPQPGPFDTTLFFIKHLFGGEGEVVFGTDGTVTESSTLGDPFTFALDYLTVMYQKPKQILPVVCLVSPENGTGKSTFLKWLSDIYGSNATIIDNERFKQSFNSHYITKFIIGIDEGFLEVEKRAEKERLKKLATDEKQFLEFKGADVQEVDFYGKIIICSNDAESLMKIEEGEIRWYVVKVPTFVSKGHAEDPFFREKLRKEIPAFLWFLKHRQVVHPCEGRAWFDPKYIITDQMRLIVANTRNYMERVVDEYVEELFLTYRLAEITIPLDTLVENINRANKYKLDKLQVKKYLKDKKKMQAEPEPKHISFPTGYDNQSGIMLTHAGTYRYYVFKKEEWCLDADFVQTQEIAPLAPLQEPTSIFDKIGDKPLF